MLKWLYNKIKGWVMSLYVGNDSNNSPVVHLTRTTESEAVMKSGVLSGTIFHSSLPYLQQVHYENVPFYDITQGGQYPYAVRSVLLSDALIDYILAGYEFAVIVSTANSGGAKVSLPVCSEFIKTEAPYSNQTTSARSGYSYYNSINLFGEVRKDPSRTHRYLELRNPLSLVDSVLLNSSSAAYGSRDVVYSASVIVYNMDNNGVIPINSRSSSISISSTNFTINSVSNGSINLANFKPLRVSSGVSSISYKPSMISSLSISPYISASTLPLTWSINAIVSSNPMISKTGSNGVTETVISNDMHNLVNYSSTQVTYSVGCSKNTWGYYSTGFSVPVGHSVCVVNNGSFSNATYPNATTYGKSFFLSNNGVSLLSSGYTYRSSNGSEFFGDIYLYVYIENNIIKIKAYVSNVTSQRVDPGVFTGTLTLLLFSYM